MRRVLPTDPPTVEPGEISSDDLILIGTIIRNAAEIENLIDLIIERASGVAQPMQNLFLGQSSFRKKWEILDRLFQAKGEMAHESFKSHFGSGFLDFLKYRNILAHAVFLGVTPEGYYVFKDVRPIGASDDHIVQAVIAVNRENLDELVEWSKLAIAEYTANFRLEPLLEKSLARRLQPHPKAQKKRPPREAPKSQPQS